MLILFLFIHLYRYSRLSVKSTQPTSSRAFRVDIPTTSTRVIDVISKHKLYLTERHGASRTFISLFLCFDINKANWRFRLWTSGSHKDIFEINPKHRWNSTFKFVSLPWTSTSGWGRPAASDDWDVFRPGRPSKNPRLMWAGYYQSSVVSIYIFIHSHSGIMSCQFI